ncbi:alpha-1,2-fucosyltransferase [Pedobacter faecalis]|uniref:alpha-1,2-fucosyltransferase n=1 Tax=Pedobacter faecalis TaxID=3041495 RepID=UPI00254BA163|nr:alpha-1,2-fucosyltransferase [Pedobacter sp. ELA7]
MIYLSGYGQMCNNIVQFGHYYAFARENNLKIIGLRFCYKYPYFNINNERGYNWITYLSAKYGAKLGIIPSIELNEPEEDQSQKTELLKTSKLILVNGWYFRKYELFLKYRPEIKKLFDFNTRTRNAVEQFMASHPANKPRIGLHIRRGDYATWHDGKYFFSDEDYAEIISGFLQESGMDDVSIYIVSNHKVDVDVFQGITKQRCYTLNGNPGEDLCLLSKCEYIIGPPSTFSLVASFYSDADLYWIFDKHKPLAKKDFRKFDYWFRNII